MGKKLVGNLFNNIHNNLFINNTNPDEKLTLIIDCNLYEVRKVVCSNYIVN